MLHDVYKNLLFLLKIISFLYVCEEIRRYYSLKRTAYL